MIKSKYLSFALVLIVLILLMLGLVRACMSSRHWDGRLYRVAYDKTWYPVQLHGKDKNMIAFAAELLITISKDTGARFELVSTGSDDLFIGLNKDKYDAVFSTFLPHLAHRANYLFSNSFYLLGPVLVVHKDSDIHKLQDMEGKLVGISSGTSLVFNTKKYPALLLTSYNNMLSALVDLDHHVIDGVFLDAIPAYVYTTGFYSEKFKVLTAPLTDDGLCLVTKNTYDGRELIDLFNDELDSLKRTRTYQTLLNKWNLFDPEGKK